MDYYNVTAQVLPVLYLAIVFEQGVVAGRGPNVFEVFGLNVQMGVLPRWFRIGLGGLMLQIPIYFFAGEALALRTIATGHPTAGTSYFVTGAAVIGGVVVLLPLVNRGIHLLLDTHERRWAETIRVPLTVVSALLGIYGLTGLLVMVCG